MLRPGRPKFLTCVNQPRRTKRKTRGADLNGMLFTGYQMDAILDASVQLIQVGLLLILIAMNYGLRARLKAIEAKLAR